MPGEPPVLALCSRPLLLVPRMQVHPRRYPMTPGSFMRELVAALAAQPLPSPSKSAEAIERVRRLCNEYTPEPPPIFRGEQGERGRGFNEGTRTLAFAVLATLDDTLNGDDR